jgi:hypothetical protein
MEIYKLPLTRQEAIGLIFICGCALGVLEKISPVITSGMHQAGQAAVWRLIACLEAPLDAE